MGYGFGEDVSVLNYKDDVIKMCKEKMDWNPGLNPSLMAQKTLLSTLPMILSIH